MLSDIIIAIRNLFRNRRRSFTTIMTVVIGSVAVMVFGGFATAISLGLETSIVRKEGHLHIYPKGYLEYGAANPTAYAISNPDLLIEKIMQHKEIKDKIINAVPVLKLNGIAGNFREEVSKTFSGYGIRPDDVKKMAKWDGYNLGGSAQKWDISDKDLDGAVVGIGMARMLSLCDELNISNCKDKKIEEIKGTVDESIKSLMTNINTKNSANNIKPTLDLLASTGKGAPNVVSVEVHEGIRQAATALDDMFVGIHLKKAQKLVHGGEDKVTAITLQLKSLKDAQFVKSELDKLLSSIQTGLEVRELGEFDPMFLKVLAMFNGVFFFVSVVIAIVVLFTVANTMTMSVVERTNEVGTLRALGMRRSGIRRQFIIEGGLIGLIGASAGIITGIITAYILNTIGLTWTPPSSPVAQPLIILPLSNIALPISLWCIMIIITIISSLAPANRAAKQTIVDAIHHI